VTYTYKGETTVIPKVTGDFCGSCDEYVLDAAQSRRSMKLLRVLDRHPDLLDEVRAA
jgi:HTH-type transcriptional regulator / antitoxin MqsA